MVKIKTAIVNYGASQHGKTTTIRTVCEEIVKRYSCIPPSPIKYDNDNKEVYALFKIGNVTVGIESYGDPESRQSESLKEFLSANCDIIITACRPRDNTRVEVENLANHGYRLIMAKDPLYESNLQKRQSLNNCHYLANYILDIFNDTITGRL